jgi:hypothetical protein
VPGIMRKVTSSMTSPIVAPYSDDRLARSCAA